MVLLSIQNQAGRPRTLGPPSRAGPAQVQVFQIIVFASNQVHMNDGELLNPVLTQGIPMRIFFILLEKHVPQLLAKKEGFHFF